MQILSPSEEKQRERYLARLRFILKLAKHVGKRRVSRFCNGAFYLGHDATRSLKLIAPYHRGLLLHIDTNSWLERWVFTQGCYEPELIDFLERSLRPGMVAVDVGANIGCHTLVMASAVGAGGRVFAFEPNPAIYERLRANICLNRFTHVEAMATSLSDRAGAQTLFAPLTTEYNQGVASMHRGNLGSDCQQIDVNAVTLDDFADTCGLERLDLLKIDVEGHEYRVLAGAREVLKQFKPVLILEFSQAQWANAGVGSGVVESYLAELGYDLFVLQSGFATSIEHGVSEECNLLGVPRSRLPRPPAAKASLQPFDSFVMR